MLDKNKFKYFAAEKGIPLNVLATEMGMNPATLSKSRRIYGIYSQRNSRLPKLNWSIRRGNANNFF